MSQELGIILRSKLDQSPAAINDLNKQIQILSTKVDKIALGIDVKLIEKQLETIQKFTSNFSKNFKLYDTDQLEKNNVKVYKGLQDAVNEFKKLGEVKVNTSFNELTKQMEGFTLQVTKADGVVEKLKFDLANVAKGSEIDKAFVLRSSNTVDDSEKIREKQLQDRQKLQKQIQEDADKREQQSAQQREKNLQEEQKIRRAIQKEQQTFYAEQDKLFRNADKLDATGVLPTDKTAEFRRMIADTSNMDGIKQVRLEYDKILDLEEKIILENKQLDEIEKQRLATIRQRIEEERKLNEIQSKAINKALEDKYKSGQSEDLRVKRLGDNVRGTGVSDKELTDQKALVETLKKTYGELHQDVAEQGIQVQKVNKRWIDNERYVLEANVRIQDGKKQIIEYKAAIDSTTRSIRDQGAEIKNNTNGNLGILQQFKVAMARVPIWLGATTAIFGTKAMLESMLHTIIEVDKNMTELQKVMNQDTNFDNMLQSSINIANELGNSLDDIQKAMIGFASAGFNEQDTVALAKVSTIMSNISELKPDEAMSTLTSAMIQFKLSTEDAITVADKLNKVSNDFPVTFANLAQAMERSGSSATTFGVSLESMIGDITAIGSVTRESGRIVGNSLEIIYSRIGTMKDSVDALNAIGIKTTEINGDNRSATAVLNDLHKQWDTLSNSQRQNLGISIAGRDQLSRFLALMNNYENGLKAAEEATHAQGSAMLENERYMGSLEAKINKLKNAWAELSLAVGDAVLTDSFVAVLGALNGLAKIGTSVAGSIGVLPILLGTIGIAAILMSKRFREAAISTKILQAGFTGLTISAETLKVAFRSLLASTVVGVAFAAIGFAIEKLIGAFAKAKEESQQFQDQNNKSVDSYSKHASEIDNLVNKYEQLNTATNNGKSGDPAQLKEYADVQNKLNELMPSFVDNIDKEGNAHLRNAETIKTELDYIKELTKIKQDGTTLKFSDQFKDDQNNIAKAQKKVGDLRKTVDEMQKALNNQGSVSDTKYLKQHETFTDLSFQLKTAEKDLGSLKNKSSETIKAFVSDLQSFGNVNVDKSMKDIVGKLDFSKLNQDQIKEFVVGIDNAAKNVNNFTVATEEDYAAKKQYIEQLGNILEKVGALPEQVKKVKDAFSSSADGTKQAIQSATDLTDKNKLLTDSLFTIQDEVKPLNDALDKMASGHDLTSSEINNLIKTYPNLIKSMKVENGQLKINADAIRAERDVKVGSFNQTLQAYKLEVDAHEKKTIEDLKLYGLEITAIESVAQARELAAQAAEKATAGASDAGIRNKVYSHYNAELEAIVEAKNTIQSLQGAVDVGFNFDTTNDNMAKGKEIVDEYTKSIAELDLALERLKYELDKYPKSSQAYRDGLQKEIDLIEQKIKLTEQSIKTGVKANQSTVSISPAAGVNPTADSKAASFGLTKTSGYRSPQESVAVGGYATDDHTKGIASDFAGSVEKMNEFAKWATSSGLFSKVIWQGKEMVSGTNSPGHFDHVHVSWKEGQNASLPSGVSKEDFNDINKAQQDVLKYQEEVVKLKQEIVNSKLAEFENQIQQLDVRLKISESVMGQLNKSSQKYRDEVALQIDITKQKQQAIAAEADLIRKSGITTDELTGKLGQLSTAWWDMQTALDRLNLAKLETDLAGLDEKLKDIDFQLKVSDVELNRFSKTSKEYRTELLKQIGLLRQKQDLAHQEADAIRASGIVTDEMNDKLKGLSETWWDYQSTIEGVYQQIQDIANQTADDIVDTYKKIFEKQRDAELDALDKRNKAEQQRHDNEMKRLDDELGQYEEIINAKLKLIDKEAEQEDYAKSLAKAQKERADIQKQIDVLALDDSIEAKAKREDLQKQLGEKDQSIEEMQTNRTRELRKQNLQDSLDAYKKDIDAKKEAEDAKYKAAQDAADKERETIQRKYENMLEDERFFAKLRKDILDGNLTDINKNFEEFTKFLQTHSEVLGESITTNLIDKIKELKTEIDDLNSIKNSIDSSTNTPATGNAGLSAEERASLEKEMADNSAAWWNADAENKKRLEKRNQEIGARLGKKYDSNTGKWTYDEGGFVGGKAPSKIGSILNKLFNDRPDRQVVKSLLGEMQIPPKNIPNVVESMRMMVSSMMPNIQLAGAGGSGGDTYQAIINIDSFSGSKRDYENLEDKTMNMLKKLGKK